MFEDLPDILTFEECRSVLKIGKNSLLQMLWEEELKGFKIGRCWRIPKYELMNYIRRH